MSGLASITEEGTTTQNQRDTYIVPKVAPDIDLQKDFVSIFDQRDFSDVTLVVENK